MNTTVDASEFQKRMQKLAILEEKTGPEVLKDQGRLLTRDVLAMTPPTGQNALTEGPAHQKRVGQRKVRADFKKVYRSVQGFINFLRSAGKEKAADALAKYARAGNIEAVKTMAKDFHLPIGDVVVSATESDYDRLRDSRTGRAAAANPLLVLRTNSVKQLLKAKLDHVGQAKAGWVKPASGLGVKIPEWVSGHPGSLGQYDEDLSGEVKSITIGNLVDYAQKFEGSNKIVENAVKARHRAMELRISHLIKES